MKNNNNRSNQDRYNSLNPLPRPHRLRLALHLHTAKWSFECWSPLNRGSAKIGFDNFRPSGREFDFLNVSSSVCLVDSL